MTRTFDLIKNLVDEMDMTIKVNSISANGLILSVCNTLHLRHGSTITDSIGQEFIVEDFDHNQSITLRLSDLDFTGDVATCELPMFIQGKWISTNEEYLLMDSDTRKKVPFIWLVRGYEEIHNGLKSSVQLEVEPIIYFLDSADFDNWLNEDHDKNAVNPMYNLAIRFVETIQKKPQFKTLESWKIQDEPRFGVKISNSKGNSKRILSDDLSGVGLRVPIKYFGNCNNCN